MNNSRRKCPDNKETQDKLLHVLSNLLVLLALMDDHNRIRLRRSPIPFGHHNSMSCRHCCHMSYEQRTKSLENLTRESRRSRKTVPIEPCIACFMPWNVPRHAAPIIIRSVVLGKSWTTLFSLPSWCKVPGPHLRRQLLLLASSTSEHGEIKLWCSRPEWHRNC